MKVKSLYVVNLGDLVREVNESVLQFKIDYNIDSVNDLTNLFAARMLARMVDIYKSVRGSFIVFYLYEHERKEMLADKSLVNYKKYLNIIEKKVDFPLYTSSLKYESFVRMLGKDCPEYDEIINSHRSFAACHDKLAAITRRFKYKQIHAELRDPVSISACLRSL